jgi:two-component system cell cycle response regulator
LRHTLWLEKDVRRETKAFSDRLEDIELKILIAEDNPVSRRLLETCLTKWDYEVISAKDGSEAWEVLQKERTPRLAILDWMMPKMDGVQVCRKVRQGSQEPYVYILLLTAKDEKSDLVKAMEAGADDYLTKPFEPDELKVRLRAGRRIIELQEEVISTREALRVQATHDSLTALWNHSAILARANREGTPVGIAMADLDHFKRVNDTYGHMAGDAVLREAAKRMLSLVRPYDAIGRYGGEEFLIIVPGCDAQGVLAVTDRIRSAICEKPVKTPDAIISMTISLGVTATGQAKKTDMKSLIRIADAALYTAKRRGRNRVELAPPADLSEDGLPTQEGRRRN